MAERPTAEPEIIPPDRGGKAPPRGGARVHVFIARSGGQFRLTGASGLVAVLLALLILAAVAAVLLVLIVGLAIWIPALIVLAALAALFRLFRRRPADPRIEPPSRLP